ncbi:phospholipase D-like domain-containing protein [Mycoplasmopsis gallinarum]|uniref:phospholipase D-like domain-containing protein n=1 Tax=Mycoplasmopsis gallinarum TaxID=29557 RepID=UPI00055E3108|nr:phospholipase D-like domain-containing protein [Mycoplasmopsis gallinarum]
MAKFIKTFFWIFSAIIFYSIIIAILFLIYKVNVEIFIVLVFLSYFLNALTTIVIFNQNRSETSKLSWMLLIITFPLLGHLCYFAFGSKFRNKKEQKLIKNKQYYLQTYEDYWQKYEYSRLEQLSKLNRATFLKANYNFYHHPHNFFEDLFKQIKEAKKSIYLISYILKPGEILDTLCDLLLEKANQGVKIHWLIDDFGRGLVKPKYFVKLKKNHNVEIVFISKVFYPFIHSQNFYRNHQKFYVIDNEIVFGGGCNISDEYVGLSKKYGDWVDLNYVLRGKHVNSYILLFLKYWKLWGPKKSILNQSSIKSLLNWKITDENENSLALLTHDSPVYNISKLEYNLLFLISIARKKIRIATPYFSVPSSIINSLILALNSGVEIEIYFPGLPDKKIIWNSSLNELKKLEEYGLKLYIYQNSFLHSKCGIIDDSIGFVGSSNMDMRSMYAQYELLDIFTGEAVSQLNVIMNSYQHNSYLHKENPIQNRKNLLAETFYEGIKPLV